MKVINENTTLVVALSFTDEDEEAVIPNSAYYSLYDVASGTAIVERTAFSPAAATHDLTITAAQNAILDDTLDVEKKRLTVEIQFGTDNKAAVDEYIYAVKNLEGVS